MQSFFDIFNVNTKESINTMLSNAGIFLPTQLPIFSNPPKEKALQAWVENHSSIPRVKNIATKLAEHINYIPFETLLKQLQITITQFNSKNLPYILWIPQLKSKEGLSSSDLWITGLSFEHCGLNQPVAIAFTNQLIDVLQHYPKIQNILLLDDASYSAAHIKDEIRRIGVSNTLFQRTLHIGIPFMTTHAVTVLENAFQEVFKTRAVLLDYKNLPMMNEILTADERIYLEKEFGYRCDQQTLTYFEHRYPDVYSTLRCFQDGSHLLILNTEQAMKHLGHDAIPKEDQGDESITAAWNAKVQHLLPNSAPVVPSTVSPYKLQDPLYLGKVKIALETRKVGLRTVYPIQLTVQKTMRENGIYLDNSAPVVVPKTTHHPGFEPLQAQSFFKPKQTLLLLGSFTSIRSLGNFLSLSGSELGFMFILACLVTPMFGHRKKSSQQKHTTQP